MARGVQPSEILAMDGDDLVFWCERAEGSKQYGGR